MKKLNVSRIKKFTALLLSFCLLMSTVVIFTMPVFAAEKDFKADYFPTGKLQTPAAPYLKETQFEGQSTQLAMFYYQTADFQKLALDIQKDESFYEKYGIDYLKTFIQIDVKFNNGPWLSSKGEWDKLGEYGINYGDNINDWNLAFLLIEDKGADNGDKLQRFTQSWLVYFESDNPINDFYKPYIKTYKNEYDENEYVFDFDNVTITYRIRNCVQCLIGDYTENREEFLMVGDWSPEVSIGKNGNQVEPKMPKKLDAPVLSEFKLVASSDGTGEISYFASLPDSIYEAERYRLIVDNGFESYALEAQVKINNGDWQDCYVANNVWLNNGYRSVDGSELNLKGDDDAWIRVRVVSTQDENEKSDWSNIIGTKAVAVEYKLGDANMDERVNTRDAKAILRYVAKLEEFTDKQKVLADVNLDKKVNTKDAKEILKFVAKLDSVLDKYN